MITLAPTIRCSLLLHREGQASWLDNKAAASRTEQCARASRSHAKSYTLACIDAKDAERRVDWLRWFEVNFPMGKPKSQNQEGVAMKGGMGRRQFLKTAGAGALAGTALGMGTPLAHAAPTDASKTPRLLAGCCAYSYREALTHGKMTLEDFILKAVELKIDAVDMTVYYLKSTDPGYLENLRYLAYKNAVTLSGAACGSSMVQADAAKRDEVLKQIKDWIDITDRLGASHLRVFAGVLPEGASMRQATDWVVEGMKAACDYAAPKGIMLGLEDHSGVSQSADVCLEIMHRVNSPYAGINLDITNFIPSATQDFYAQIAACLPYATVSHIRDRFIDKSLVDLDRVWKMYAEAGHRGYMSLEYEADSKGGETAEVGIPKALARIQELCTKYSSV
jgi:sugar phosphate isomerase/epimerase